MATIIAAITHATTTKLKMRLISATSLSLATPAGLLLPSIEAGGDEFRITQTSDFLLLQAGYNWGARRMAGLFTELPGIGILGSSPFGISRKYRTIPTHCDRISYVKDKRA